MADVDHATVWRGALCERPHAAHMDRAKVWRGALCERQHAAAVDRATVWHCKNSIESEALPQKEHSSNSIEFNDFTIF